MKLLLDECLPHRLRHHLRGHDAYTVAYMGWRAVKNGTPLARAAAAGFEVLVTTDAGIEHQHNPADLPTAVVILHAASNDLSDLLPLVPGLLAVLNTRPARVVRHVLAAT